MSHDQRERDHIASLAARAASDRAAFGELYDRFATAIFRYCYRRTGNRELAEDAMSQTFTRAFEGMSGFGGGSFPAWLFTIAHNVVINQARRPRFEPLPEDMPTADPQPGPEAVALMQDERARIVALLDCLPSDQRRVVEFRLSGLSGAEIAAVMERSVPAIKMLQLRAMRRLRSELSACEPGGINGEQF
ncbi:MAG: RNA polymerase sigma factor [Thermomicrobiales bacterium]